MTIMHHLSVPGYIHSGFFDYLRHIGLVAANHRADRDRLIERIEQTAQERYFGPEARIVAGYSSRCLFDLFLAGLGGRKISVTPFLHTGFQRIIDWNGYEADVLDVDRECRLEPVDPDRLQECDAVLITHVFGGRFDVDDLVAQANRLGVPVFEDCVQSGFINRYPGHRGADVAVFSGGQDKVPVSFGGGLAVVRNDAVFGPLRDAVDALPSEPHAGRLKFLLGKVPIVTLYNSRAALLLMMASLRLLNTPTYQLAASFRKNVSGFVHDRTKYHLKPSAALLASMLRGLKRDYTEVERRCRTHRRMFLEALGDRKDDYLPWHEALKYADSTNFYHHLRVDDPQRFIRLLDAHGFCAMHQQSWHVDRTQAPVAADLNDHLIIIPSLLSLTPSSIRELAAVLRRH
jgi:dTDP-4-amino-4,6-dideoxygalactose transaminase